MLRLWDGYRPLRREIVGLYRRGRSIVRGLGARLLGRRGRKKQYGHLDSVWPTPIDRYYRDTLDRSHYPRDGFWFDPPA